MSRIKIALSLSMSVIRLVRELVMTMSRIKNILIQSLSMSLIRLEPELVM
jgi:hypothetical protein